MPYRALLTAAHDSGQLIDVDHLIDYPWLTVTKITYATGTRYDLTCCEITESDDYALFFNSILPPGAVMVETIETNTLPDAEEERTSIFWSSE